MRIISGKYKGRRLTPPPGLPVRPTTDKARESLFNILMTWDFTDMKALDLFAGTGSIGLEFISRGMSSVTAVEKDRRAVTYINKVADELGIDNLQVVQANVFRFLERGHGPYDIIFADPPYDLSGIEEIPGIIFQNELLEKGGLLILEHDQKHNFSSDPNLTDHRKYGKVQFSIFSAKTGT